MFPAESLTPAYLEDRYAAKRAAGRNPMTSGGPHTSATPSATPATRPSTPAAAGFVVPPYQRGGLLGNIFQGLVKITFDDSNKSAASSPGSEKSEAETLAEKRRDEQMISVAIKDMAFVR